MLRKTAHLLRKSLRQNRTNLSLFGHIAADKHLLAQFLCEIRGQLVRATQLLAHDRRGQTIAGGHRHCDGHFREVFVVGGTNVDEEGAVQFENAIVVFGVGNVGGEQVATQASGRRRRRRNWAGGNGRGGFGENHLGNRGLCDSKVII